MLALHYLILTTTTWMAILTIFKLDLPKHFLKVNITILLSLVAIDMFRFVNHEYHPLIGSDMILVLSLILITSLVLLKKFKAILALINLIIFNNLIMTIASGFVFTIFQIELYARADDIFYSIIANIIGLILLSIVYYVIKKSKISFELAQVKLKLAILTIFILFSYGIYINLFLIQGNLLSENLLGQSINLIAAIAGLGSVLIMFGYIINRGRMTALTAEKEMNRRINTLKEIHFQLVEAKDKETRAFRHDIMNHLSSLNVFIKESNFADAQEYINKINGNLAKIQALPVISTGIPIIDANINYLQSVYQNEAIEIEIDGIILGNFPMDNHDITTLFSNVLSNAFEATTKLPESKFIKMRFRETNNSIYIAVSNNFDNSGTVQFSLETNKINKDNHGFGISKIMAMVEKYDGTADFLVSDGIVTAEIILPKFRF